MQHVDALFVINQNTSFVDLARLQSDNAIASACVLTTHRLLPAETAQFGQLFGSISAYSFADLLSDTELSKCDEQATSLLLANGHGGHADYNARFTDLSLREKNRLAHDALVRTYTFAAIYYSAGLGVSESYWGGRAHPIGTAERRKSSAADLRSAARRLRSYLRRIPHVTGQKPPAAPREVAVIRDGDATYVFVASLKRLRLRPETTVQRAELLLDDADAEKNICDFAGRFAPTNVWWCMTVHDYDSSLAPRLPTRAVFVDGYHPSNYPRTYLDSYSPDDVFVVRTMMDERWFAGSGFRTSRPPRFIEREYFEPCRSEGVARILIVLNHAGDWTALINRSDTDDLVIGSVELSRALPDLTFRVRMHPTMDHPAHEGANASSRLANFVASQARSNLQVSSSSLSEDLAWCDMCVSEYSQVLLDAWRDGKLGLALNMTKRRSFMQDYADLGFLQTSGLDEATAALREYLKDPVSAVERQNTAVAKYNAGLRDWLRE